MPKKKQEKDVDLLTLKRGGFTACILGTTPLLVNRMQQKALEVLLVGGRKKTSSERASILKHDPMKEFRGSPYTNSREDAPTLIEGLPSWFANSMRTAALDMDGVTKSSIKRQVFVEGHRISIYGVPQLAMHVVKTAGMNGTPDVRTRAVLPEWCCEITVTYQEPILRQKTVMHLLAAAGALCGVAEWRPEKGGTFGQFEMVDADNPIYQSIIKNGGRDAQVAAMESPEFFDEESAELMDIYNFAVEQLGFDEASSKKKKAAAKRKSKSKAA